MHQKVTEERNLKFEGKKFHRCRDQFHKMLKNQLQFVTEWYNEFQNFVVYAVNKKLHVCPLYARN